jgi:lipid-binding SYLF domain-containing protein
MRKTRLMMAAAVVAMFTATAFAPAARAADEQATVNHAQGTLQDLRHDKEFGNARQLLHRARAIMIAPRIFKAGFFIGGEGGDAVLVSRQAGGWSSPAFFTLASASFGLQIGAQESEVMMFIMSDKALRAVMKNEFKVGANAGLAIVTLGSSAEGATTTNAGADLIVWASASGVYAGISLDGSIVAPDKSADANYYGRPVTSSDIVVRRSVRSGAAAPLLTTLGSL